MIHMPTRHTLWMERCRRRECAVFWRAKQEDGATHAAYFSFDIVFPYLRVACRQCIQSSTPVHLFFFCMHVWYLLLYREEREAELEGDERRKRRGEGRVAAIEPQLSLLQPFGLRWRCPLLFSPLSITSKPCRRLRWRHFKFFSGCVLWVEERKMQRRRMAERQKREHYRTKSDNE